MINQNVAARDSSVIGDKTDFYFNRFHGEQQRKHAYTRVSKHRNERTPQTAVVCPDVALN